MKRETYKRSAVKSISWRILATLVTMMLVWVFTGQPELALSIGVLETLIKMAVYYAHERTWNKIDWELVRDDGEDESSKDMPMESAT